jgi:hypothetical protein
MVGSHTCMMSAVHVGATSSYHRSRFDILGYRMQGRRDLKSRLPAAHSQSVYEWSREEFVTACRHTRFEQAAHIE